MQLHYPISITIQSRKQLMAQIIYASPTSSSNTSLSSVMDMDSTISCRLRLLLMTLAHPLQWANVSLSHDATITPRRETAASSASQDEIYL